MNFYRIDLNLLVVFEVIYTKKNLTKAGEKLNISQPAVSNALNRLREMFDDPLFVRTSQGMLPTLRAEELADPIKKVLFDLNGIVNMKKVFVPKDCDRTFWLSMTDFSETVLLSRMIERLSTEAPKVNITVFHSNREERHKLLESGKMDLAIYSHYPNRREGHDKFNIQFTSKSDLYQQKLFDEQEVCVSRKNHPQISNDITIDQFIKSEHIHFAAHQGMKEISVVDKVLMELKLKRNIKLKVSNTMAMLDIISRTDLIGVVVKRLVVNFAENRNIKLLDIPFEMPPLEMTQYWHERHHNDPAHKWFRNIIQQISKNC
jgi:DNA-binding transcriptional LysR family regulator